MAPHSSTLAWKIPWTEEPGGLQSMGSRWSDTTERLPFHFSLSCIGEGIGNPLQCSCLENPRDGGAWWAAIYGVAQSRTRLKWLSSSSRKSRLMQTDVFHDLTESDYLDWIQMMLQSLFMWHMTSESLMMRSQSLDFQFGTICCYIKSILFFFFFNLFIYWPYLTACRILILLLGVGPRPQKWKHQILMTKPPSNSLHTIFFF